MCCKIWTEFVTRQHGGKKSSILMTLGGDGFGKNLGTKSGGGMAGIQMSSSITAKEENEA